MKTTADEPKMLTRQELKLLVQLWGRINKVDEVMDDIKNRLPWAHAVWLQRRDAGWIAFVRADKGGYSSSTCNFAIEAVTELWMHYSEQEWKQEQETGK